MNHRRFSFMAAPAPYYSDIMSLACLLSFAGPPRLETCSDSKHHPRSKLMITARDMSLPILASLLRFLWTVRPVISVVLCACVVYIYVCVRGGLRLSNFPWLP